MSRLRLPGFEPLPGDLLERYAAAHLAIERDLVAASEGVRRLFISAQRNTTLDCLSSIRPSIMGVPSPPLFPAPRAFLSAAEVARRAGVEAAFRYVDSRIATVDLGYDSSALLPESPYVINALSEGRTDNPQESNAGMVRSIPTFADHGQIRAVGALEDQCRPLLELAMETVTASDEPAITRAAWLSYMVFTIHPFIDGNGRTARLLYLLVAGTELPLRIDWNAPEIMLHERRPYTAVLKEGQGRGRYDVDNLSATPWMLWSTEASIRGTDLGRRRLAATSELLDAASTFADDESATLALVATWLNRMLDPKTVGRALGMDERTVSPVMTALHRSQLLERIPVPPSRRRLVAPPAYRVSDAADAALRDRVLALTSDQS